MGTVAMVELILLPWKEKRSCLFVCCSFSFLVSAPYKYLDDASIKQFMPDYPYWRRLIQTCPSMGVSEPSFSLTMIFLRKGLE